MVDNLLELYSGPLKVDDILNRWYNSLHNENFGAFISFVGTVRDEDRIEGLSFDIYEPILKNWFNMWQEKAKKEGAIVLMAHSIGDVPLHKSSYISAVCSPKRKIALKMIDEFVEDFKKSAPIWKYDIVDRERVYAKDRSSALPNSGLLGR